MNTCLKNTPEFLTALDDDTLTAKQWSLAFSATLYPVILGSRSQSIIARALEKKGWGEIENGGSGEKIFRINQAGCDAFTWFGEVAI